MCLTLSPNLSLSLITTSDQPIKTEPELKLIKEDFKQVGGHKLLRKTVIQLTLNEYSQLKACFPTIDSFISFINVQQTTTGNNESQQH